MHNVEDIIMFGSQGVCRISEIAKNYIGCEIAEFYVLEPIYDQCSTSIFIPVKNEALTAKMRRIITADEIYEIIKSSQGQDFVWIEDENLRNARYSEIIKKGDIAELITLIKTLYYYKQKQKEKGRKFYVNDGNFLKKAEKMISSEFAFVLNIEPKDVIEFIIEQTKVQEDYT